jgi:hypothetical protein
MNPLFNFTNFEDCVNVYISPVLLLVREEPRWKKKGGEANELRQKTDNGDSCKSRSPSHQTEAIEKDE